MHNICSVVCGICDSGTFHAWNNKNPLQFYFITIQFKIFQKYYMLLFFVFIGYSYAILK